MIEPTLAQWAKRLANKNFQRWANVDACAAWVEFNIIIIHVFSLRNGNISIRITDIKSYIYIGGLNNPDPLCEKKHTLVIIASDTSIKMNVCVMNAFANVFARSPPCGTSLSKHSLLSVCFVRKPTW